LTNLTKSATERDDKTMTIREFLDSGGKITRQGRAKLREIETKMKQTEKKMEERRNKAILKKAETGDENFLTSYMK